MAAPASSSSSLGGDRFGLSVDKDVENQPGPSETEPLLGRIRQRLDSTLSGPTGGSSRSSSKSRDGKERASVCGNPEDEGTDGFGAGPSGNLAQIYSSCPGTPPSHFHSECSSGAHTPVGSTTPHQGGPLSPASFAIPAQENKVVDKLKHWKKRSHYYVPILAWMKEYEWNRFTNDLVAGLTVACVLIPLSMSYAAGLAHLNPVHGLWSACIPPVIYAILGSCRHLNLSPEATISLLIGQTIKANVYADPHNVPVDPDVAGVIISTLITFETGIFTLILGLFRFGFLDSVLNRALLRGFITAVAFVVFIEQLSPLLRLPFPTSSHGPHTSIAKLRYLFQNLHEAHALSAALGVGLLLSLIAMRFAKEFIARQGERRGKSWQWVRLFPEILVTVIVCTILTERLRLDKRGIEVLGPLNVNGLESAKITFPLHNLGKTGWKWVRDVSGTAMTIAIVGYIESIVASKALTSHFGYAMSPNREMVALGTANALASFVPGTIPAFGSITRSILAVEAGAYSQMYQIVNSVFVFLTIAFLVPFFHFVPKPGLSAVILLVVAGILKELPHDLKFWWRLRAWRDLCLFAFTFAICIAWSLQMGVLISLSISVLLVIKQATRARVVILGKVKGSDRWRPIDADEEYEEELGLREPKEEISGVLIVRIKEELNFGNAGYIKERLRRLELYGAANVHPSEARRREAAKFIVFHMGDVGSIDSSAIQIFDEIVRSYVRKGVDVFFCHVRYRERSQFERAGIVSLLGRDHFTVDVGSALHYIHHDAGWNPRGMGGR